MIHPFTSCIGIELISPLHKMALETKSQYESKFDTILTENSNLFPNHHNKYKPIVNYIEGSFFDHEWSNASVVFSNSTCFDKYMMDEIFVKAESLPKGTIFVNTSQKMPKNLSINWQVITPFQRVMSWGLARVFIYRRK